MTVDHHGRTAGKATLLVRAVDEILGTHTLPPSLADAALQLISNGRSYRGVGSPPTTIWLFPGHLPGRPITPARLGERLRAIGIYAQTARRAALLDLAPSSPPRSSQTYSACTRPPPQSGRTKPEATGPATRPS
jgi:hypothetical protein